MMTICKEYQIVLEFTDLFTSPNGLGAHNRYLYAQGYCFQFALILKHRFPEGEILGIGVLAAHEPCSELLEQDFLIAPHYVLSYHGEIFDIDGIYTGSSLDEMVHYNTLRSRIELHGCVEEDVVIYRPVSVGEYSKIQEYLSINHNAPAHRFINEIEKKRTEHDYRNTKLRDPPRL